MFYFETFTTIIESGYTYYKKISQKIQ